MDGKKKPAADGKKPGNNTTYVHESPFSGKSLSAKFTALYEKLIHNNTTINGFFYSYNLFADFPGIATANGRYTPYCFNQCRQLRFWYSVLCIY